MFPGLTPGLRRFGRFGRDTSAASAGTSTAGRSRSRRIGSGTRWAPSFNSDVPQEVVRRILDHDSHMMTARYALLSDTTIRRHCEQARKVNVTEQAVTLDPVGPLAEASWAKHRVSRATQALPNGYCALSVVKTCPYAKACLTCPMLLTTPEFLPEHHQHRRQVVEVISAAQARGQQRLAEMNQHVLGNLDLIIAALQDAPFREPGDADAG